MTQKEIAKMKRLIFKARIIYKLNLFIIGLSERLTNALSKIYREIMEYEEK